MENTATINGLLDGISVLESNNNNLQPAFHTDILYNDKEPIDFNLQEMYYDEGYSVTEYQVEDFGQSITLLSTITMKEAIVGSESTNEYGFKYNY